jgi:hypothetical protein
MVGVLAGTAVAMSLPVGAVDIVVTGMVVGASIGLIAWSPNLR